MNDAKFMSLNDPNQREREIIKRKETEEYFADTPRYRVEIPD